MAVGKMNYSVLTPACRHSVVHFKPRFISVIPYLFCEIILLENEALDFFVCLFKSLRLKRKPQRNVCLFILCSPGHRSSIDLHALV